MSEEMKKDILNKELSDEELKAVNGGGAKGSGACNGAYYEESCDATMEKGSWCWSNDYCAAWDSTYTETDAAITQERQNARMDAKSKGY